MSHSRRPPASSAPAPLAQAADPPDATAARPAVDLAALADELMRALTQHRQITPLTTRHGGLALDQAYRVAGLIRHQRQQRGETPVGRKIGFTNRTIWAQYDVWAPIWGTVYDSTLHLHPGPPPGLPPVATPGREPPGSQGPHIDLAQFSEPRIEPEIVFGLARSPDAGRDTEDLMDCIGWVAHGFEIVRSVYPGWKFAAADTVAAFGLHGALWLGPRSVLPADAPVRRRWQHALEHFEVDLLCDGVVVDHGHAGDVLDGPLHALRHLVVTLAADPTAAPLQAGELVSTGTLTRALPVQAGQTWSTHLKGLDLPGLCLAFV